MPVDDDLVADDSFDSHRIIVCQSRRRRAELSPLASLRQKKAKMAMAVHYFYVVVLVWTNFYLTLMG